MILEKYVVLCAIKLLLMQHFLKAHWMIAGSSCCQQSTIHWQISSSSGFLRRPPAVYDCGPLQYHSFHFNCSICFMGLLTLTSSGCIMQVIPLGITARCVLYSDNSDCFTSSYLCALKASSTSRERREKPPGRQPHTVLIQSWTRLVSIHPYECTRTSTPFGHLTPLGMVLRLKTT
ncbi:hypothetical protein DPMN_193958 [Dreissena polymorpha]|uniref:Secreted protein n=1 Tax=Dreissena polymorpha TaxID=45954 RepID=A0A9D4B7I8_DREPO|nr:hypothetical protein DPMN_193958 [Dreissena polymorpha]